MFSCLACTVVMLIGMNLPKSPNMLTAGIATPSTQKPTSGITRKLEVFLLKVEPKKKKSLSLHEVMEQVIDV